ncbi:hypothetical protein [Kribbella shirazensis]|uniref:Uncharacterized protein n=1 Tax=Kribbella shirazensis TaxID=1105143 RepID=A0A7X5VER6_9ACTN|nr:hypothetical protein [Kribbella shirazensis]NIK59003.1 hypothetical protein [Kribbella shirazensis]
MSTVPTPPGPVPPLDDPADPDRIFPGRTGPEDDPDLSPYPEPEPEPDADPDEQLPRDT